jgi:hypothetical protein
LAPTSAAFSAFARSFWLFAASLSRVGETTFVSVLAFTRLRPIVTGFLGIVSNHSMGVVLCPICRRTVLPLSGQQFSHCFMKPMVRLLSGSRLQAMVKCHILSQISMPGDLGKIERVQQYLIMLPALA